MGPASGRLFPSIIAGICAAGICPSPTDSSVPDKIRTILYKKPFPQKVKRKSSMPEGSVTVSTVIESIRRTWDLPGVLSEVKLVKSCVPHKASAGGALQNKKAAAVQHFFKRNGVSAGQYA